MVLEYTHGLFITYTEFRLATTFIPIIIIYMATFILAIVIMYNRYPFYCSQSFTYIYRHELWYNLYMALPLATLAVLLLPLLAPLCPLFHLLGTLQL